MSRRLFEEIAVLMTRPFPFYGESKRGYLLRLCEENGLNGFDDFQKLLRKSNGVVDSLCMDELINLVGYTSDELSRLTLWSNGNQNNQWHVYHGKVVHNSAAQKYFFRYCPMCLEEEAYVRSEWHINPAPACLRHEILLHDRCSSCHQAQSWSRTSITRCEHCYAPLTGIKVTAAGEHVLSMQRFILAKMQDIDIAGEIVSTNPAFKWLLNIDTDKLLSELYFSYMDIVFGGDHRWSYIVAPSVESSYEMLSMWYYGLLASPRYLTRILGQKGRPLEMDAVDSVRGRKQIPLFDWADMFPDSLPIKDDYPPQEPDRYEEHFNAALPSRIL